MAFTRAFTALATLEEKLRRSLGLAGEIGASFEPKLTPVIIANDLREPGNAVYRGRHFSLAAYATYTAAYQSITFPQDVILTSMLVSLVTAGQFNLYLTPPGVAPASNPIPFQNIGTWTDNKTTTNDFVPFLISTLTGTALLGTDQAITNRIFSGRLGSGNVFQILPQPIMLPAGSNLNWHLPGIGDFGFGIQGRVF